jgi:hypothetical protein
MASDEIVRRAAPVQIPEASRALQRVRLTQAAYRDERAALEHRSMVRGLLLLAMVVLVLSIARAGLERVFLHGWWRHW